MKTPGTKTHKNIESTKPRLLVSNTQNEGVHKYYATETQQLAIKLNYESPFGKIVVAVANAGCERQAIAALPCQAQGPY